MDRQYGFHTRIIEDPKLIESMPLYRVPSKHEEPLNAYLTLDPGERSLFLDYDRSLGGKSKLFAPSFAAMELQRVLQFRVCPNLTRRQCYGILADEEILALSASIVEGYSCTWDGDNWCGTYSDTAHCAIISMANHISENYAPSYGNGIVMTIEQWLDMRCEKGWEYQKWPGVDNCVSDDQLEEISQQIIGLAEKTGINLTGDIIGWLKDQREND